MLVAPYGPKKYIFKKNSEIFVQYSSRKTLMSSLTELFESLGKILPNTTYEMALHEKL
jgi:hypothetical protein